MSVLERRTFGQAKALEHTYHLVSISNHYLAEALKGEYECVMSQSKHSRPKNADRKKEKKGELYERGRKGAHLAND